MSRTDLIRARSLKNPLAKIERDSFLADIQSRGYGLPQAYEACLLECIRDGGPRESDREPAKSTVEIFADGIDANLRGRDASIWNTDAGSGKNRLYHSMRETLEVAKTRDKSFPRDAIPWEDTKGEAVAAYIQIAKELELPKPLRSKAALEIAISTPVGTLSLEMDTGGWRRLAGRVPIYFHFKPARGTSVFLSDLRWMHPSIPLYFVYATGKEDENGVLQVITSNGQSAVHGIRASLVFLKALVAHTA